MLNTVIALFIITNCLSFIYWRSIMATIAEVTTQLNTLTAQVERNRQEVLAKIAALEETTTDVVTTPEFDAAFEALKSVVQKADDDVA